jgi:hypothetical protein
MGLFITNAIPDKLIYSRGLCHNTPHQCISATETTTMIYKKHVCFIRADDGIVGESKLVIIIFANFTHYVGIGTFLAALYDLNSRCWALFVHDMPVPL